MSSDRIQRGYKATEDQYGSSLLKTNQFAYMAVKENDARAAQTAFRIIGDHWDKAEWRTTKYFNECKVWANRVVATANRLQAAQALFCRKLKLRKAASCISRRPLGRFKNMPTLYSTAFRWQTEM